MPAISPCLTCGACCAYFRATFYWGETDAAPGGCVPAALTDRFDDFRAVLRGTGDRPPRCLCLTGQIGARVACAIYEQRASVCREFEPAWQQGQPNERCDRARAAWGLRPLGPSDWQEAW